MLMVRRYPVITGSVVVVWITFIKVEVLFGAHCAKADPHFPQPVDLKRTKKLRSNQINLLQVSVVVLVMKANIAPVRSV